MTIEYKRHTPLTPRTMSQNRNSPMGTTRKPRGTNTGLTDPAQSSVSKSMNIPTPTAPGGHRQTPYGGRTMGPSQGTAPGSTGTVGPTVAGTDDTYQRQLATMNRIKNRGEYGMAIPRGNPQSPAPSSIYRRPANGRRY